MQFLLDRKQRRKEKSCVLRLERKKNQIETLDPIVGQSQSYLCLISCNRNNFAQYRQKIKMNTCREVIVSLLSSYFNKQSFCGRIP